MSEESKQKREPITAPTPNNARDVARVVAEGIADFVPGGSIVTGILGVTHPPKSEIDQSDWQGAISERSNEHDARLNEHDDVLAPKETIEGLTAQLISKLVRDCPDGLATVHYELRELCALFPDEDPRALEDAVFDLKTLGLLKSRNWLGGWAVALDDTAYEQLDRQIMGWDTNEDAISIARLMLSEETGHAPDLHAKTGWAKRRFNPAFGALLPNFPDGRVRAVLQSDYPALGVMLVAEDRANLRRLIARHERGR